MRVEKKTQKREKFNTVGKLKGIVSRDKYFLRLIIINRFLPTILSVHALIIYTVCCFLVDEKNQTQF